MNYRMRRCSWAAAFICALSSCGGGGSAPPAIPTVALSASSQTITLGDTITVNWTSSNANSCSATGAWSGTLETNGSRSIVVSSFGSVVYSINCSGAGGSASANVTITSNANPPTTPTITASMGLTAVGVEVTYTATATDPASLPLTYTWDFGDGTTGSGSSVTKTYRSFGNYTIKVTATNSAAKISNATYSQQVQNDPLSPAGIWGFSGQAGGCADCQGYTYESSSVIAENGDFIIWWYGYPASRRIFTGNGFRSGNTFSASSAFICESQQVLTSVKSLFEQAQQITFTSPPPGSPCAPDIASEAMNLKLLFKLTPNLNRTTIDLLSGHSLVNTSQKLNYSGGYTILTLSSFNAVSSGTFYYSENILPYRCFENSYLPECFGQSTKYECKWWGGIRQSANTPNVYELFDAADDARPTQCAATSARFGRGLGFLETTDPQWQWFNMARLADGKVIKFYLR